MHRNNFPTANRTRSGSPFRSVNNSPGLRQPPLHPGSVPNPVSSNVTGRRRNSTRQRVPMGPGGGAGGGAPGMSGDGDDGDDGEGGEGRGRGKGARRRKGKGCGGQDRRLEKRKDDHDRSSEHSTPFARTPKSDLCKPLSLAPMSRTPSSDPVDDDFTPPPEDVICMRANTPTPMQTPPPPPRVTCGPDMQLREQQAHRPGPGSASPEAVGWDRVGETQVPSVRRENGRPVRHLRPTGRLEVSAAFIRGREGNGEVGRKRRRSGAEEEDEDEDERKGGAESCDDTSTTGSSRYDSEDDDEGGSGASAAAAASTTSAPDSHDSGEQDRKRPRPSSPSDNSTRSARARRLARPFHRQSTACTRSHPTFSCTSPTRLNPSPPIKKPRTSPPQAIDSGRVEFTMPYFNTLVSIPNLTTAGIGLPLPPVSSRVFGSIEGGKVDETVREEDGKGVKHAGEECGPRGEGKRRLMLMVSPTLPHFHA